MFGKKEKEQIAQLEMELRAAKDDLARARERTRLAEETLKKLNNTLSMKDDRLDKLNRENDEKDIVIENIQSELDRVKLSLAEYEKTAHVSDSNHIYFLIDDDLITVTPTIRYKPGVEEKLIEQRIIQDGDVSPYTIQIGLALVVKDALDYMVESATEGVSDGD